jgi:DNA-binding transcriptional MerR regulator
LNKELDLEWLELIKEALSAGISKEEIRVYLQNKTKSETEFEAV